MLNPEKGKSKGRRIKLGLFKTHIKFLVQVMAQPHKQSRGGGKAVFSAAERTDHVRLVKKSE